MAPRAQFNAMYKSTHGSNIGLLYWKNVNQLNRNGMDGKNYLTHERVFAGAGVRTRLPKTSEVFGRNSTNTNYFGFSCVRWQRR